MTAVFAFLHGLLSSTQTDCCNGRNRTRQSHHLPVAKRLALASNMKSTGRKEAELAAEGREEEEKKREEEEEEEEEEESHDQ